MSTYVSVKQNPYRITVICTECNIDTEYPTYNKALNQCKAHTLFEHPEKIVWAN